MASTTVAQLAGELNRSASALLEQLQAAGVQKATPEDVITESDKTRLLDYLKRAHGSAEDGARKKITITKRETSEIRQADATGKTRTVQVEVKKKRVLVKRDEPNAALAESEAAEAAPVVDAEEVARREEEHRRQAELLARQEAELKARQEAMEREEAERRARQRPPRPSRSVRLNSLPRRRKRRPLLPALLLKRRTKPRAARPRKTPRVWQPSAKRRRRLLMRRASLPTRSRLRKTLRVSAAKLPKQKPARSAR